MEYDLKKDRLSDIFLNAERELLNSNRLKFKKCNTWRKDNIPNTSGVYAIFNKNNELLYIGESGDLNARMNEINRTVNHSFRKQLGSKMFDGIKSKKKFADNIEQSLDEYFDEEIYISFLPVNFGRLEIETYLISKHQNKLYNSEKKRR